MQDSAINAVSSPNGSRLTFAELVPKRTDRIVIAGQTGSGKTTLAQRLLEFRDYVVAVDFKGTLNYPGFKVYTSLAKLVAAKEPKLTYRPDYAESVDETIQERFWEWVYRRRNTTIYVDETAAITRGDLFPYYYGACLMRGRELGLELWSATQRPMRIPQVVLSESEHVYVFRLRLPQDRQRMEQLTGIEQERIHALPKLDFLYAAQDASIVGPLRLNL